MIAEVNEPAMVFTANRGSRKAIRKASNASPAPKYLATKMSFAITVNLTKSVSAATRTADANSLQWNMDKAGKTKFSEF